MLVFDIIDKNKKRIFIEGYRLVVKTVSEIPIAVALNLIENNEDAFYVAHAGEPQFDNILKYLGIDPKSKKIYIIDDESKNDNPNNLPKVSIYSHDLSCNSNNDNSIESNKIFIPKLNVFKNE